MLTSADRDRMRADLIEIRQDNQVEISIRRGTTTLPSQKVRVARLNSGSVTDSAAGQQSTGNVVVLGGTDFNVQVDDRFPIAGSLYQVKFVRPNRTVAVVAEAIAIQ